MGRREHSIFILLSKSYTYKILKALETGQKRYRDLDKACHIMKMRSQRLKELENSGMVSSSAVRDQINGRATLLYSLTEKGRKVLTHVEEIKRICGEL